MIRTFLTYLLPFLLPIIIYFTWIYFRAKKMQKDDISYSNFESNGWPWVLGISSFLLLIVLFFTAFIRGSNPDSVYTPPSYEDGVIIPGQNLERDEVE